MSADKIRTALAALIADPEDVRAWELVEEIVTGDSGEEVARELERARAEQERLHAWPAAARMLDLELAVAPEGAIAQKQLRLARIYHEELCQSVAALAAYQGALRARPDDPKVKAAIAEINAGREKWQEIADQAVADAKSVTEGPRRAHLLASAADTMLRYRDRDETGLSLVADLLEQALAADPANRRALSLAALCYEAAHKWSELASVLERTVAAATAKADKIAAQSRLARLCRRLRDDKRAVEAHVQLLDLDPGSLAAVAFLVDHFTQQEDWERLVALYQDQLASGSVKQADEFGVWVQIAMLNWQTLKRPDAAEPFFDKVRRADPTHAGMLRFFRERCREKGDGARLMAILTDAQRATGDEELKRKLAEEIAGLAEGQENAKRAIEQYKTILRSDPNDDDARDKLKALYLQTESFNALVELYRQDLQRLPKEDVARRVEVLRSMAAIYKDRLKSDTALLTVLTQILQHDDKDVEAVRGLIGVYEALGRWRDLLNSQQKLADITDSPAERVGLLRAVARRWLEQFSNVQNATAAYEALLDSTGDDVEAREKLRELYDKRRAWPKLYELYERQLQHAEGDKRVEIRREMAKLAAERLDKGAEAIALLKEIYAEAPTEAVLDQLEKQAERQKDYAAAAFVLQERVGNAGDEHKLVHLQKLGALQSEKLGDEKAALDTWRRVLELSPGHSRALRVLRQALVEARDFDGLRALYASQDDWEGLADFLSTTADRCERDDDKVELSFRAARIFEEQLEAPERAARSYERVLSVRPKDVCAAKALLPLYEREEKWSRLPGLHAILLEAESDVDAKIGILHKMASITGGPLANKAGALGYARQAYELRPDDEGLRRLREWSQGAGEWTTFIEVVKERLGQKKLSEKRRRELNRMLAEVYESQGKIDEAAAIYRELCAEEPGDRETVATFERLLRGADRRDELRWLFALKAERFEGEERMAALEEWARVEEDVFGEPARAIELYEQAVAQAPDRVSALSELARLLLSAERYPRAAEVMLAQRNATAEKERAAIELRLARLYHDHLAAPDKAFEAAVRALDLDEHAALAVKLLEELVQAAADDAPREPDAVRARAATRLEEIYAAAGRPKERVLALKIMLEHEPDAKERLTLCARLAQVLEENLGDKLGAFEVVLNTLLEAPDRLDLWDRAQRLGVLSGRPTDLAQAYRRHLDQALQDGASSSLDESLRVELCERAARLQEDELGDPEGAIPYLRQVLATRRDNQRAFARLKAILTAAERWSDLEELYRGAIDKADDDKARVDNLAQAALLAEEMMGDDDKAIGYYERIAALDSLHEEALQALERLYGRQQRYADLTALLERRLDTATDDEAAPIRLQLADLYLHALKQHDRVMAHIEAVLARQRDDDEARELCEECLAVPELRPAAALMLDGVYEERDEFRELGRVLAVRLESANDQADKAQILRRLSDLRHERLKDDAGAFEALQALVPLEPEDAGVRERFMQVGRRLGEHQKTAEALSKAAARCELPQTKSEMLMAAARLYRTELDQSMRAEKLFRQALELDPDDPSLVIDAARALADIYEERGDHEKLAAMLAAEVRLTGDVDARKELFERIAALWQDAVGDAGKAIEAWRSRLSDDAGDAAALQALEKLYRQTEEWSLLVETLHQLEQVAPDAAERKRCMIDSARVLSDKLEQVHEAINAWRAVVDDFGPEPSDLEPLAALYDKAERWEDLAEVLEVWLSLVEEPERKVELLARLGEVRRLHLGDAAQAIAAYRQVLDADAGHKGARAALEALLEHEAPEIKREAAEIIGPLYRADGDAERTLKVIEIEIESTYEPAGKLEIIERALNTAEDILENPGRAFDYAARGVREAIGDASMETWIATAERLAAATDRFGALLDLYEGVVDEMLDAEVQHKTRLRAGEIARERLDDPARAIRHFRAALDARSDDQQAMLALEELYHETRDDQRLLEILRLRAEGASDKAKIELLLRAARLQAGPLDDRDAAIRSYEDVLDIALNDEAASALEKLYTDASQHESLVRLYERQLDAAMQPQQPAEGKKKTQQGKPSAAAIRVKIARVAQAGLNDTARALDELDAALAQEPMHPAAIDALEQMLDKLDEPDQKAHVAKTLEPVYRGAADWNKLKGVLEARVETCHDPAERGQLLEKLALLYEEQLEDFSMALETVARRLRDDPGDEGTWDKIESLGRVIGAGAENRVAEIFAAALKEVGADDPKTAALCERTGELFAIAGKPQEALPWYRRAHEFNPDSEPLFRAIDELLDELGQKAERIEHYRRGAEQLADGAERVRYLRVIAGLEREVGRPAEAIDTLRTLLDVAPDDEGALDALTELYRHTERDDDLADLYQRRAEMHDDPAKVAPYRLLLARLLSGRKGDPDGALDQLEPIVAALPAHPEAIAEIEAMLGDDERRERVVDILLRAHQASDDWKKQVGLNEHRLALQSDVGAKAAVLLEAAQLWEDRGDDLGRAFELTLRAFELNPADDECKAQLERLAEATSAWDALARAYERAAAESDDAFSKRALFAAVAEIADQRLDDPRRALAALAQVATLDPSDEAAVAQMNELCVLLGDWDTLARVLSGQAEQAVDAEDKASLFARLGEIRQDMIGDDQGATLALEQAIELSPDRVGAIDRLLALYQPDGGSTAPGGKDALRLGELYERRIELTEDEERRRELLVCAAELHERELKKPEDAIRLFEQALELGPTDGAVLAALERLYRAQERWAELLDNLKTQANVAQEEPTRVDLQCRIAELLLDKQGDAAAALDVYRVVLEEAPREARAIAAARGIAEKVAELRAEVAALLEPIYADAGRFEELLSLLELKIAAEANPAERAQTLASMARIEEEQLEAPGRARDTCLRALREKYREGAPATSELHEDVERLCALDGQWGRYADLLGEIAAEVYDGAVQCDLYRRLGRVAENELKDPARAILAFRKAAEQSDEPGELLASLDRLYLTVGDLDKLAEVLSRRIEAEPSDRERAQLVYRAAKLQLDHFEDKAAAAGLFKRCAEIDPEHAGARQKLEALTDDRALFDDVAETLDAMYRVAQDQAARGRLRNKRIDYAESAGERVRLRLELAQMLEDESFDPIGAQQVVQQALFDAPTDAEVMVRLSRLCEVNAAGKEGSPAWRRAADAGMDALGQAKGRGAEPIAPDAARDAYLTLADWYGEHVSDDSAAEKAIVAALEVDSRCVPAALRLEALHRAPGREKDLCATLRKLAALGDTGDAVLDRSAADLRREAKILAETALGDAPLAEAILREMIASYDGDPWALSELCAVCEKKGDFDELFKLLHKRIELTGDGEQLRELRHQAAKVAAERLGDAAAAVELYEQAFDDDPSDEQAAASLRRLYKDLGRGEDTLRLIERLCDRQDDPAARAELRLDSARICLDALQAPTEAIEHLHAVLRDAPGHAAAVTLLGSLLEKEGRDHDLAELYERQIDLAREHGDKKAELELRVKLCELSEQKLNDTGRAADGYRAVLEAEPGFRPALSALARLYESQGQSHDAAEHYERLLDGAAPAERLRLGLKARDLYGDDAEAACRALEAALADPSLPKEDVGLLRDALGALYKKRAAWQPLAELTARRAEEAGDDAERVLLYRQAADIHGKERGDHAAAAELLARALPLQKDNRELMLALGDEYTAAGQGDRAIAMLGKVVESYGGKRSKELAEIHLRLSAAHLKSGDSAAALRELEAARKMDAANIKVAADLGELSLALHDADGQDAAAKAEHLKRAEAVYKSLLLQKIDDGSPISKAEVFYGMAQVLRRMNDTKKAIHNLERALAADKGLAKAKELLDELRAGSPPTSKPPGLSKPPVPSKPPAP